MADQRNRNTNGGDPRDRDSIVDGLLGRDQWRRSKIGYLTGVSPIKDSLSSIGRTASGVGATWKLFGKALFSRESSAKAVDVVDPAERFQASMFIHGRTEADVVQLQRRSHNAFYLYAILTMAAIVVGALTFRFVSTSVQVPSWLNILFRFAAVPMLGGFAFRWGYTNYIVRNRSYLSAGDYLRSGDWFPQMPKKAARGRGSRALQRLSMVAIGVLLASSVIPLDAFAQTPTPAAGGSTGLQQAFDIFKVPGQNDLFMNLLSLVLPNVGPVPGLTGQAAAGSPAHNALSQGLMIFSGILLLVACTMVAWHTITGTVMSAQTGKVLGEQWSQVWSPARVVVGLGFLIPISGGFCAAQILVLYLVAWGGSAANMIWVPYVESMIKGSSTTQEATAAAAKAEFLANLPGAYDAVRQIAERELCYETLKTVYQRSGTTNAANGLPDNPTWTPRTLGEQTSSGWSYNWQYLNPNNWNKLGDLSAKKYQLTTQIYDYGPICGGIGISSIADQSSTGSSSNPNLEVAVAAEYDKGKLEAVKAVQAAIRAIAPQAVATYFPQANGGSGTGQQGAFYFRDGSGISGLPDVIKNAVQTYSDKMLAAATSAMQKGSPQARNQSAATDLQDIASNLGWASAGVYYASLARVQGVVYARANSKPGFDPETLVPAAITSDNQNVSKALYSSSDTQPGVLSDFRAFWIKNNKSFLIAKEQAQNAAMAGTSSLSGSLLGEVSDGASWWIIDKLLDQLQIDPFNAMMSLVELGHSILTMITALGAAIGVASLLQFTPAGLLGSAVSGGASKGGVIGSFFLTVGVMILSALFGAGITLAYILPMIPYMIVTFFVMAMLILVAEAMVAAPLWAFFHVRMEGQQFVESVQRPGYMISFNLLLRPALMILGLIMSYLVHGAMAWFVWQTFKIAAKSATAGFSVGPVGIVVFLVMYAYMNYMICIRCFNLATQVPDRVARWFGGQGEHTDEERLTQQAAGAISGNVANRAGQLINAGSIGAALGGGGKNNRQLPPGGGPKPPGGGGGPGSLPHLKNATSAGSDEGGQSGGGEQGGGQNAGASYGSDYGRDIQGVGRAAAETTASAGGGGRMAGYTGNEGSLQGSYSGGSGGGRGSSEGRSGSPRPDGGGDKRGSGRRGSGAQESGTTPELSRRERSRRPIDTSYQDRNGSGGQE